ncbi:MAG: serine protein kinase RIO [Candidatus Omnitrophica bacterium]|nr:serine protein kinase RIO [Candidatus Omnitrophota bacterium]
MALYLSKKKRPAKEEKMLKISWPAYDGVFNRETMLDLQEFFSKKLIKSLDYCIAKGKEANVYRATTPSGEYLAVKIYRLHTPSFVKMYEYLEGDQRFLKVQKSKPKIIFSWTKKEFSNLKYLSEIKVPVPKPISFKKNILIMEFLGENGIPYSALAQIGPTKPKEQKEFLIEQIEKMYQNQIVHADLSEYNILIDDQANRLFIIDCAQAVLTSHPKANEWYNRDKENIERYFKKFLNNSKQES